MADTTSTTSTEQGVEITLSREAVGVIIRALHARCISAQTDLSSRYADRRAEAEVAVADAERIYAEVEAAVAVGLGLAPITGEVVPVFGDPRWNELDEEQRLNREREEENR